ncbi:hypothetical protein SAMN04487906_1883 [Zhouia amylolytica]|uniref:Uncharacterized protein n=1 Tax=Zhouia amylolytica TaxID=376730 RepID=A0A1I6T6S8_9FLAO|nr:hypothetical protein SAMN04487906_1883 [Zhouia amylolytica]
MELKKATGLALLGVILITLIQLVYFLNSILGFYLPYTIINIIYFVGCVLLATFFITLYTKQIKEDR